MPNQVPQSIETEQALLGSMLLYPDTIKRAYEENLQPKDFFAENNSKIYAVIQQLNEENVPVDAVSVITRLTDLQKLEAVGGSEYLTRLMDVAISSANVDYYINTLLEKSLLRRLIEVSESIRLKSYEGQSDAGDVLNEAESLILSVSRDRKTSEFKNSQQVFGDAIDLVRQLEQSKGMTGVESGYKYIDRYTNGFQPGALVIVAARPSVGKTAFALNVAANAAVRGGKSIAFFSLEMPYIQLANRMLSSKSGVYSDKIRTGKNLTNDDWNLLSAAQEKLEASRIFIDDSSSIKVNDMLAKCRKLQSEKGLDMVLVDYLQLIAPSKANSDSREQEVSQISRALKAMARELDVPVIALSQLSRAVEKGGREPQLSDLRESGAIEQDADIVMFLHRTDSEKKNKNKDETPSESAPQNNDCEDISVIIAKNRNGSIGTVPLAFEKKTNLFITKELRDEE